MEWLPTYPALKSTHVALASASIGLFVVRGLGVQAGARWPLHRALRRGSVWLDTALLAAGAALWAMLGLAEAPWLAAKLVLIVLYVLLGAQALRRARTRAGRAWAFAGALACAAAIVGVALAHHPLGPLRAVLGD